MDSVSNTSVGKTQNGMHDSFTQGQFRKSDISQVLETQTIQGNPWLSCTEKNNVYAGYI